MYAKKDENDDKEHFHWKIITIAKYIFVQNEVNDLSKITNSGNPRFFEDCTFSLNNLRELLRILLCKMGAETLYNIRTDSLRGQDRLFLIVKRN